MGPLAFLELLGGWGDLTPDEQFYAVAGGVLALVGLITGRMFLRALFGGLALRRAERVERRAAAAKAKAKKAKAKAKTVRGRATTRRKASPKPSPKARAKVRAGRG